MKHTLELKPLFLERMQNLLPEKKDFDAYTKSLDTEPPRSIRCNTLKIYPSDLKKRLESKGWKISQPFEDYPEIMIVDSELQPGELGRALEHMLGYYYVQEIASMLPVLVLNLKKEERVLDLCASPGSKTTQISSKMAGTGSIIANEVSLGRIKILASNLERCGVSNAIITKKEGTVLCRRLKEQGFEFDKILVDAPCSGEGTLRTTPRTAQMWNINTVKKLSKIQKHLLSSALEILKVGGEIVYSTCTHAPEENEEVIDSMLKEFGNKIKVESIKLPIKCRPGLEGWVDGNYNPEVSKSCRIYPQDANTEGFFICKIKKLK